MNAPASGPGKADRVRRQRSSVLGATLLRQLPLPGHEHHRRDVADLVPAEVGADVGLGVLAVVEAGLDGQLGVGVDAVEVLVEQLVDREARRGRRRPAGVRQAEQFAASAGRCRRAAEAALGDLHPLAGQRVVAERGLEVPAAPLIGIDAVRLGHRRNLTENRDVLKMFSTALRPVAIHEQE